MKSNMAGRKSQRIAKVFSREKNSKAQFAKVNSREMQKFRKFADSRKFLPAKVSSFKVEGSGQNVKRRSNFYTIIYDKKPLPKSNLN